MTNKMRIYIRTLGLSFYFVCLIAPAVSYFGFHKLHLKVRQTTNVSAAQELSAKAVQTTMKKVRKIPTNLIQDKMSAAKNWADRMDAQTFQILQASSVGPLQRWIQGSSLSYMEKQLSRDAIEHLRTMADVMRTRRELGGFKKLREFDFYNMLRKSDYLLSLEMTRKSLKDLSKDKTLGSKFRETLSLYNQERLMFDQSYLEI